MASPASILIILTFVLLDTTWALLFKGLLVYYSNKILLFIDNSVIWLSLCLKAREIADNPFLSQKIAIAFGCVFSRLCCQHGQPYRSQFKPNIFYRTLQPISYYPIAQGTRFTLLTFIWSVRNLSSARALLSGNQHTSF